MYKYINASNEYAQQKKDECYHTMTTETKYNLSIEPELAEAVRLVVALRKNKFGQGYTIRKLIIDCIASDKDVQRQITKLRNNSKNRSAQSK